MEKEAMISRLWTSRAGRQLATVTTVGVLAAGSLAGAADATTFDTSKLESTSTAVLGVGALIAVGFAVFKIGKRAMGKV